jgi:hypothetical protein
MNLVYCLRHWLVWSDEFIRWAFSAWLRRRFAWIPIGLDYDYFILLVFRFRCPSIRRGGSFRRAAPWAACFSCPILRFVWSNWTPRCLLRLGILAIACGRIPSFSAVLGVYSRIECAVLLLLIFQLLVGGWGLLFLRFRHAVRLGIAGFASLSVAVLASHCLILLAVRSCCSARWRARISLYSIEILRLAISSLAETFLIPCVQRCGFCRFQLLVVFVVFLSGSCLSLQNLRKAFLVICLFQLVVILSRLFFRLGIVVRLMIAACVVLIHSIVRESLIAGLSLHRRRHYFYRYC